MNTNNWKYKLLSYLFLLLTLFIIFLFTKNIYSQINQNSSSKQSLLKTLDEKNKEYNKIATISSDINSWKFSEINFDKFLINFWEDELVDYFYDYANKNPNKLTIESLNLTKWTPNEFWFNEANITLNATFQSEREMLEVIDQLIINSKKYNFYVLNLSYPLATLNWSFSMTIPIKVLYK